jgi:hypothetical protein
MPEKRTILFFLSFLFLKCSIPVHSGSHSHDGNNSNRQVMMAKRRMSWASWVALLSRAPAGKHRARRELPCPRQEKRERPCPTMGAQRLQYNPAPFALISHRYHSRVMLLKEIFLYGCCFLMSHICFSKREIFRSHNVKVF